MVCYLCSQGPMRGGGWTERRSHSPPHPINYEWSLSLINELIINGLFFWGVAVENVKSYIILFESTTEALMAHHGVRTRLFWLPLLLLSLDFNPDFHAI